MPAAGAYQRFFKRGSRKALTLSRISLGFCLEIERDVIKSFRAGAGSMSPVPIRLPRTEAALVGKRLDAKLIESACGAISAELTPRKSAAWRKKMASNLLRTFLTEVSEAEERKVRVPEDIPSEERNGPRRLNG